MEKRMITEIELAELRRLKRERTITIKLLVKASKSYKQLKQAK